MNLQNFTKHLRIAVLPSVQKNKYDEVKINETGSLFLLDGYIIKLLSEIFKFSYDILEMKEIGAFQQDGNWTGCIGSVQRAEADLAICATAITKERSETVNYSHPYIYSPVTFVTDKPRVLPNSFAIFYTFSWHVWFALLISFLFMSVCIFSFFRRKHDYTTILLHMFGNLVEQSFEIKSKLFRVRILMICWVIGVMFITYGYKAVLLSFFSFPSMSGIRDIKELSAAAKNPSFQCLSTKGSFVYKALMESNDELIKPISNCMERTTEPVSYDEFVINSTYEKASIAGKNYFMKYKKSHFISDDIFFTSLVGVPVSKNFCCLDALNKAILRIIEAGLIEKYAADSEFFFSLNSETSDTDDSPHRILILKDLYGAFVILIVGLLLSTVVLVIEIVIYNFTKHINEENYP